MERALPGADNDEVASLRHYTLAKQEVVASVRAAKQLFQAHGAREAAERCQELLIQLAEDRFNLALAWHWWRIRRNPVPFHDTCPLSFTLSVALPLALYLTWWYAPAFSVTSDAVLFFGVLSMVLAALRGYAGCEMLALSNWLLHRSDQIACAIFTPIDSPFAQQAPVSRSRGAITNGAARFREENFSRSNHSNRGLRARRAWVPEIGTGTTAIGNVSLAFSPAHNHPLCSARRAASMRFCAPSFCMAVER